MTKQKTKICFRCKKIIEDKSNYFSFTEYSDDKIIKIDYAHKVCWDSFLNDLKSVKESKEIIRGLKGSLIKMGMLPEEKVVVV